MAPGGSARPWWLCQPSCTFRTPRRRLARRPSLPNENRPRPRFSCRGHVGQALLAQHDVPLAADGDPFQDLQFPQPHQRGVAFQHLSGVGLASHGRRFLPADDQVGLGDLTLWAESPGARRLSTGSPPHYPGDRQCLGFRRNCQSNNLVPSFRMNRPLWSLQTRLMPPPACISSSTAICSCPLRQPMGERPI